MAISDPPAQIRSLGSPEAPLREILDNTTAVIFAKDLEGRYLLVNRQFLQVVGRPASEVLGRRESDVIPGTMSGRFRENDQRVIERGTPVEFEESFQFPDGEHSFISLKFPLRHPDGSIYGVCGVSTDITGRKRIEEALRQVALGVSAATGSDVFGAIARSVAQTLGVDLVLVGKRVDEEPARIQALAVCHRGELIGPMEYPLQGTPCEQVVGHSFQFVPAQLQARFPDNDLLAELGLHSYAGYPLFDSRGTPTGLIAVLHGGPLPPADFTENMLRIFSVRAAVELERLLNDQALRSSEASFRAIIEASEDAIYVHDLDTGAIVDVNPKACSALGYTREEMLRLDVGQLGSGIPPYTAADAARWIDQAREGRPVRFEWHRRNRDGSLHWDEVWLKRVTLAGVDRIVAFTRDITERREAEEQRLRLETQLRQAQKMEAIGQLTGGIAHDFNNILTGVLGYVVLAQERAAAMGDTRLLEYLDRASRSGQRARDLIQQMLTFSRGQRGDPRALSPAPLVNEAVQLLRSTLPATVSLATELDPGLPPVMVDPVQLEQVLMNLCINARDAMDGRGHIQVRLRHRHLDDGTCASCRKPIEGGFVELSVADEGPGVTPEHLDRIFDPFFTTKGAGQGSGMGLAMVHGIVHEHGGHVTLLSKPGRGTEFRVLWPALAQVAEVAVGNAAEDRQGAPSKALQGHVLLADDDAMAGAFMQDLLEEWGLDVTRVHDGTEACERLAAALTDFQLALLDRAMPGLSGLEVAAWIRDHRPGLPVILYTGYSEDLPDGALAAAGIRALVRKPVDTHALWALLKEVMRMPHPGPAGAMPPS
jgi:PAS domain S-box-containing protein